VTLPVDAQVLASYDPNAASRPTSTASALHRRLIEAIGTYQQPGASVTAAPNPTKDLLREMGSAISEP
jgi:hypothetical protein